MFSFIHDVKELKKFFTLILPPLTDTEVYFTSLSARNKQLTEKERKYYSLGRTEMFERKTIRERDWNKFLRTIRKYETNELAVTGRGGIPLPGHCLIIYININPCDCLKAYKLFQDNVTENVALLLSGGGSGQGYFKRLDRELMNAVQKAKGVKHYIDIDIDINDKNSIERSRKDTIKEMIAEFCLALIEKGVKYFLIETKGGYHILMRKNSIKFNFNEMVADWHDKYTDLGIAKEIKSNDNAMIPLPGCYQAGFPVVVDYERSSI